MKRTLTSSQPLSQPLSGTLARHTHVPDASNHKLADKGVHKNPVSLSTQSASYAISDDERKLWQQETQQITPLKNKTRSRKNKKALSVNERASHTRAHAAADQKNPLTTAKKSKSFAQISNKLTREDFEKLLNQTDVSSKSAKPDNNFQPQISITPALSSRKPTYVAGAMYHDLQSFDVRLKNKIAKGHTPLEERIDLHGLSQQAAFSALQFFIQAAYQRGVRNVLVITGKGKTEKSKNLQNILEFSPSEHEQSGVLRRQVPQWLKLPSMKPYVQMLDYASQVHGGEGALYIRLRRSPDYAR